MPWGSGTDFANRHNKKLHGDAANKAVRVANALLKQGADEGKAIRIANSIGDRAMHRDVGGSIKPPKNGVDFADQAFKLARQMAKEQEAVANAAEEQQHFQMGGTPEIPAFERSEMLGLIRSDQALHPPGLISGAGPGRTDTVMTKVPSGSYVLPADVVSGLGAGNSFHGADVMNRILSTMPYGTAAPRGRATSRMPRPPAPFHEPPIQNPLSDVAHIARGGTADEDGEPVDVALSSGEFLLYPHHVRAFGGSDLERGHSLLDKFVIAARKKNIKTLKDLPGPKKANEK